MDYGDAPPAEALGPQPQEPAIWENLIPFWGMHARNKYAYERDLYEKRKDARDADEAKTKAWRNENVAKFYESQLGDLKSEAANITTTLLSVTDKLNAERLKRAALAGAGGNKELFDAADKNVKALEEQYDYFSTRGVAVNGLRDKMGENMGALAFDTPPPHAREAVAPPMDSAPPDTGGFGRRSSAGMPPPLSPPQYDPTYSQPIYSSPQDRTSPNIPRTDMQIRSATAPQVPVTPPDTSQGEPWTPGTAGPANAHPPFATEEPPWTPGTTRPANAHAFQQPAIPPELQPIHAALDRLISLPIEVSADGHTLEIVATTADQAKEAERQVKDLQAQQKAQYKAAGIDLDPALPVSIRYGAEDKKAEDAAKVAAAETSSNQDLLKDQAKSYETIGTEIRRYEARKASVEAALLPEVGAAMMYAGLAAASKGEDGEAPDPMMSGIAKNIENSKGNEAALRKVGEAMKKHLDKVIGSAKEDRADYEPGYKAQQARLKKMGIEVTSKKDRFYLKYVAEHFDGKSITELTDEERGELKKAWAKQEAE